NSEHRAAELGNAWKRLAGKSHLDKLMTVGIDPHGDRSTADRPPLRSIEEFWQEMLRISPVGDKEAKRQSGGARISRDGELRLDVKELERLSLWHRGRGVAGISADQKEAKVAEG